MGKGGKGGINMTLLNSEKKVPGLELPGSVSGGGDVSAGETGSLPSQSVGNISSGFEISQG
jgi:hypothetical protein